MNSAWHGNEDIMAEKVDYGTLKKGGFMRQKQKNNFSLRLAVVGGYLTAENLIKIAEVADKYGDGHVHLTSRQGVEIPFIKLKDIDAVKEELAEGGCRPGVCGPRVRTVTACQGNTICPSGNIDSYDIAVKLDERYFGRELPHKFKFGVTGCQNNCLKAEEKACRTGAITMQDGKVAVDYDKCNYCGRCAKSCPTDAWDAPSAYIISFAGTFGNSISKGESPLPLIRTEEQLFRVCDAAIQFFADNAKPSERFKFTLDRVGREEFYKKIKEAYNG